VFLDILFKDRARVFSDQVSDPNINVGPLDKSQTLYGCGPQSVPVIDPKILNQFKLNFSKPP